MSLQSNLQSYLNKSKSDTGTKSYLSWFKSSNDSESLIEDDENNSQAEEGWYSTVKEDPWLPTLVYIYIHSYQICVICY